MATRAVHLEIAEDYSSEAFISALHRFTARREHCSELFSDKETNFVGADKQLRQMFHEASSFYQQTSSDLSCDGPGRSFVPAATRQPFVYAAHAVANTVYTYKLRAYADATTPSRAHVCERSLSSLPTLYVVLSPAIPTPSEAQA